MNTSPLLSFCITCKNRFHQIRNTLSENLQDNALHSDRIEFVLVDFNSDDGLREWVIENFRTELTSGYLKYYYTEELPQWHACIAKNTAHACATGEILVNLDCDNFTGANGGNYVMKKFEQYGNYCVVHQFSGKYGDGSFGRIAVGSKYFGMIGGYDESFDPMGYQDADLMKRLIRFGLKYVSCTGALYNRAIPNTKEESIVQTNSPKTYDQMNESNQKKSMSNLSKDRLIANNRKYGIRNGLFDHHGQLFQPNQLYK